MVLGFRIVQISKRYKLERAENVISAINTVGSGFFAFFY